MGYGRNSLEGFFVCGILSHQDPNWFAFELCLKQIDFEYFVQMLRWRPQDDLTKSGLYQHGSSRSVSGKQPKVRAEDSFLQVFFAH